MELTTLLRVKEFLDIPEDREQHDKLLRRYITRMSVSAAQYMHRDILVASDKVEVLDLPNWQRPIIQLKTFPITSVTDIRFDVDSVFGDDTIIDAENYRLLRSGQSGQIGFYVNLVESYQSLQVTYSGGMATDTQDFIDKYPDIADAIDEQIGFRHRNRDKLGMRSKTVSGTTVDSFKPQTWLEEVTEVLDQYVTPQL